MKKVLQILGATAGVFFIILIIVQVFILLSCMTTKKDKETCEMLERNFIYRQDIKCRDFQE